MKKIWFRTKHKSDFLTAVITVMSYSPTTTTVNLSGMTNWKQRMLFTTKSRY